MSLSQHSAGRRTRQAYRDVGRRAVVISNLLRSSNIMSKII
jgi:hypothetical protein